MAVQDDLASLFAKNLTLTQQPPPPPTQDDKIVYISQHYTHTAHISAHNTPPNIPRPTSEPDLADLEHILSSHGVETAGLSLPQVELFRRADDDQKARLVQLWTICPPAANSSSASHALTWSATSLEQEEMLARRRYDEQQQQQQQEVQQHAPEVAMSLDGTDVVPQLSNSPGSVQSVSSGAWESSPPAVVHAHTYMEPYMQSGYEELARREYDASVNRKAALDPVYQGGMLDWERQQWMENQYGSFVGGWRDDEEML